MPEQPAHAKPAAVSSIAESPLPGYWLDNLRRQASGATNATALLLSPGATSGPEQRSDVGSFMLGGGYAAGGGMLGFNGSDLTALHVTSPLDATGSCAGGVSFSTPPSGPSGSTTSPGPHHLRATFSGVSQITPPQQVTSPEATPTRAPQQRQQHPPPQLPGFALPASPGGQDIFAGSARSLLSDGTDEWVARASAQALDRALSAADAFNANVVNTVGMGGSSAAVRPAGAGAAAPAPSSVSGSGDGQVLRAARAHDGDGHAAAPDGGESHVRGGDALDSTVFLGGGEPSVPLAVDDAGARGVVVGGGADDDARAGGGYGRQSRRSTLKSTAGALATPPTPPREPAGAAPSASTTHLSARAGYIRPLSRGGAPAATAAAAAAYDDEQGFVLSPLSEAVGSPVQTLEVAATTSEQRVLSVSPVSMPASTAAARVPGASAFPRGVSEMVTDFDLSDDDSPKMAMWPPSRHGSTQTQGSDGTGAHGTTVGRLGSTIDGATVLSPLSIGAVPPTAPDTFLLEAPAGAAATTIPPEKWTVLVDTPPSSTATHPSATPVNISTVGADPLTLGSSAGGGGGGLSADPFRGAAPPPFTLGGGIGGRRGSLRGVGSVAPTASDASGAVNGGSAGDHAGGTTGAATATNASWSSPPQAAAGVSPAASPTTPAGAGAAVAAAAPPPQSACITPPLRLISPDGHVLTLDRSGSIASTATGSAFSPAAAGQLQLQQWQVAAVAAALEGTSISTGSLAAPSASAIYASPSQPQLLLQASQQSLSAVRSTSALSLQEHASQLRALGLDTPPGGMLPAAAATSSPPHPQGPPPQQVPPLDLASTILSGVDVLTPTSETPAATRAPQARQPRRGTPLRPPLHSQTNRSITSTQSAVLADDGASVGAPPLAGGAAVAEGDAGARGTPGAGVPGFDILEVESAGRSDDGLDVGATRSGLHVHAHAHPAEDGHDTDAVPAHARASLMYGATGSGGVLSPLTETLTGFPYGFGPINELGMLSVTSLDVTDPRQWRGVGEDAAAVVGALYPNLSRASASNLDFQAMPSAGSLLQEGIDASLVLSLHGGGTATTTTGTVPVAGGEHHHHQQPTQRDGRSPGKEDLVHDPPSGAGGGVECPAAGAEGGGAVPLTALAALLRDAGYTGHLPVLLSNARYRMPDVLYGADPTDAAAVAAAAALVRDGHGDDNDKRARKARKHSASARNQIKKARAGTGGDGDDVRESGVWDDAEMAPIPAWWPQLPEGFVVEDDEGGDGETIACRVEREKAEAEAKAKDLRERVAATSWYEVIHAALDARERAERQRLKERQRQQRVRHPHASNTPAPPSAASPSSLDPDVGEQPPPHVTPPRRVSLDAYTSIQRVFNAKTPTPVAAPASPALAPGEAAGGAASSGTPMPAVATPPGRTDAHGAPPSSMSSWATPSTIASTETDTPSLTAGPREDGGKARFLAAVQAMCAAHAGGAAAAAQTRHFVDAAGGVYRAVPSMVPQPETPTTLGSGGTATPVTVADIPVDTPTPERGAPDRDTQQQGRGDEAARLTAAREKASDLIAKMKDQQVKKAAAAAKRRAQRRERAGKAVEYEYASVEKLFSTDGDGARDAQQHDGNGGGPTGGTGTMEFPIGWVEHLACQHFGPDVRGALAEGDWYRETAARLRKRIVEGNAARGEGEAYAAAKAAADVKAAHYASVVPEMLREAARTRRKEDNEEGRGESQTRALSHPGGNADADADASGDVDVAHTSAGVTAVQAETRRSVAGDVAMKQLAADTLHRTAMVHAALADPPSQLQFVMNYLKRTPTEQQQQQLRPPRGSVDTAAATSTGDPRPRQQMCRGERGDEAAAWRQDDSPRVAVPEPRDVDGGDAGIVDGGGVREGDEGGGGGGGGGGDASSSETSSLGIPHAAVAMKAHLEAHAGELATFAARRRQAERSARTIHLSTGGHVGNPSVHPSVKRKRRRRRDHPLSTLHANVDGSMSAAATLLQHHFTEMRQLARPGADVGDDLDDPTTVNNVSMTSVDGAGVEDVVSTIDRRAPLRCAMKPAVLAAALANTSEAARAATAACGAAPSAADHAVVLKRGVRQARDLLAEADAVLAGV